jgi:Cft2 family RNA processing exonuclease
MLPASIEKRPRPTSRDSQKFKYDECDQMFASEPLTLSTRHDGVDVRYQSGIYLPAIDVWLDPTARRDRAVVTHAHSDHVRRHDCSIVTPGTARLIEHRYRPGTRFVELECGERTDFGAYALTLLPAGHVRGSAQVLVEHNGERLLYSGDVKLTPSHTAEPAVVPEADVVIVEATFGRPQYRFPPAEHVMQDILAFCRRALEDGCTPVLFAYSLGKGQELLGRLAGSGFDIAVHGTTFGVNRIYEQLGVEFPVYSRLDDGTLDGKVLICPPQARRGPVLASLRRTRTAYISGWAVDRRSRYRMGVDAAFPLSDHADYDELLEYVRRANARQVYTIFGFAGEFAADLCRLGYDARPIKDPMQYRLM